MIKLHFDIRDIFRVIRLGWSGKKIWIGLCGMIVAWAGYSILVIISHLAAGATLSDVWQRYGLFPGATPASQALLPAIIGVVGMLFALAVFFLSTCMMCKVTFQQLKGDDFYSSGDALKFIKENWRGVLFGPVATVALFAFFVVVGIVIGLLGRYIPYVGEFALALGFIPIFFCALVAVFIAIAIVVSVSMSPAIVGSVGEDSLEVVIQSFSLTWSQPWRLVLYCLWMKVSVGIGAALLAFFMTSTLGLLTWACGLFMGGKLANMLDVAQRYVPVDLTQCDGVSSCLPAATAASGSETWSGYILAAMLLLLLGVFFSYIQAAYASGTSLIYVILRKKKDDENLLEWEDEALDDEPAPLTDVGGTQETEQASGDAPESAEEGTKEGGAEASEGKPDGGS
jgi:hypothetical protein